MANEWGPTPPGAIETDPWPPGGNKYVPKPWPTSIYSEDADLPSTPYELGADKPPTPYCRGIVPPGPDRSTEPVEPGPTPPGRYDLEPWTTGVYPDPHFEADPPPTPYGQDDKTGIISPDPTGGDKKGPVGPDPWGEWKEQQKYPADNMAGYFC